MEKPGNKWALLIGIDAYRELQWMNLNGCKNDVRAMADLLMTQYDFPPANIELLLDEKATRDNIVKAMADLQQRVCRDDVVVLYYAGHGSQLEDLSGHTPTGLIQTLVPHDSGRARGRNRDISDDEIRMWLLSLEQVTPYITLIFDCCHSGTMTRGESGGRSIPRGQGPLPPAARFGALDAAPPAQRVSVLPLSSRYVALAACRDEELAQEHSTNSDGKRTHHGALTYFLLKALKDHTANAKTYREAFDLTALALTARYPQQHPRCEGALDRMLFGTRDLEGGRHVSVTAQNGKSLTLLGGAAHGVAVGSEWLLLPAGSAPSLERQPLGRCRIVQVYAGSSRAELIDEMLSLPLPCYAVKASSHDAAHKWAIATDGSQQLAGLPSLLKNSPWLRSATGDDTPRARVLRLSHSDDRAIDPRYAYLGKLREPVFLVVDTDGAPLLPLLPERDGSDSLLQLCDELERAARVSHVRAINNPGSELSSAVECQLLVAPTWEPSQIDDAGRVLHREGDRVALELRNRTSEPVYVAALILGSDRSIAQIYPPQGAPAQCLGPGRVTRIGAWRLSLPQSIAMPPSPEPDALDRSVAIAKLFVTREEVNFQPLLQPGTRGLTRGASPSSHPVEQRLAAALTGVRMRSSSSPAVADRDWASTEFQVVVTRAS